MGASTVAALGPFSLAGRVAVVTGASSGLGSGIARILAGAGADVVLGARRADRLEAVAEVVAASGRRAVVVPTDVTNVEDCRRLARRAQSQLGKIDVLVNCAGVGAATPASREEPEQFRSVVDVNLMGSYWMAQACLPAMPAGASIVNVGSALALTSFGLPQAAYTASKAGLIGLTRDLAQQWAARRSIRVNLVAPGLFPTEMLDEFDEGFADGIVGSRVPMRRVGTIDECAYAVLFLASDAASYITGAVLPVDGGLLTS